MFLSDTQGVIKYLTKKNIYMIAIKPQQIKVF